MRIQRVGDRVLSIGSGMQIVTPRSAAAAAGWWEVAGKTCVAAYQPKGAASYAASKINLANPGTYDASEGVLPTWATETGWTFNGTTQYLTVGVLPWTETWTCLAQFSGVSNEGVVLGSALGTWAYYYNLQPRHPWGARYYHNWNQYVTKSPVVAAGNMAMAASNCYYDGIADGIIASPVAWQANLFTAIGALGGNLSLFIAGNIVAVAFYSDTLSAAEVATVAAAMAAL